MACGGSQPAHEHPEGPLSVPMEVVRAQAPAPPADALPFQCVLPLEANVEVFVGGFDASGAAVTGVPALSQEGGVIEGAMPANLVRLRIWASGYAPVDVALTLQGEHFTCSAVDRLHRPARVTGMVSGLVQGAWVEACGMRTDVRSDGFYDLMIPAERSCEVTAARTTEAGWAVATPGIDLTLKPQEVRTLDLALPQTETP